MSAFFKKPVTIFTTREKMAFALLHRLERKMRQNNIKINYYNKISNIEMWLLPFLVKHLQVS